MATRGVRWVMSILSEEVSKKLPQMAQTSVLGMLILRLLVPSILSNIGSSTCDNQDCEID